MNFMKKKEWSVNLKYFNKDKIKKMFWISIALNSGDKSILKKIPRHLRVCYEYSSVIYIPKKKERRK